MVDSLSWIHHKREIKATRESGFLKAPNFLNLASYPIPLYGSTVMPDRYDHNPASSLVIRRDNKPYVVTVILPALCKNPINFGFLLNDF